MSNYVIKVFIPVEKSNKDKEVKPKIKTIVADTDTEMFACIQNAITEKLEYTVYKAELTLVLDTTGPVAPN